MPPRLLLSLHDALDLAFQGHDAAGQAQAQARQVLVLGPGSGQAGGVGGDGLLGRMSGEASMSSRSLRPLLDTVGAMLDGLEVRGTPWGRCWTCWRWCGMLWGQGWVSWSWGEDRRGGEGEQVIEQAAGGGGAEKNLTWGPGWLAWGSATCMALHTQ